LKHYSAKPGSFKFTKQQVIHRSNPIHHKEIGGMFRTTLNLIAMWVVTNYMNVKLIYTEVGKLPL